MSPETINSVAYSSEILARCSPGDVAAGDLVDPGRLGRGARDEKAAAPVPASTTPATAPANTPAAAPADTGTSSTRITGEYDGATVVLTHISSSQVLGLVPAGTLIDFESSVPAYSCLDGASLATT